MTQEIADRLLRLPMWHELPEEAVQRIVEIVGTYASENP